MEKILIAVIVLFVGSTVALVMMLIFNGEEVLNETQKELSFKTMLENSQAEENIKQDDEQAKRQANLARLEAELARLETEKAQLEADEARRNEVKAQLEAALKAEQAKRNKELAGKEVSLFEYDCTKSLISENKGYGDPSSPGACPTGKARMEMMDHLASIDDAKDDCRNRGMRLPTYHELSAAANFAKELGLQSGNYWASSKNNDDYAKNCLMPYGNCGRFYSPPPKDFKQWYRCVAD